MTDPALVAARSRAYRARRRAGVMVLTVEASPRVVIALRHLGLVVGDGSDRAAIAAAAARFLCAAPAVASMGAAMYPK